MDALRVIRDRRQAATLLQGDRPKLLAQLRLPASATLLAKRLELPRQKINYHLRALDQAGLLNLVEERRARNCLERVFQATARTYVISPEILADLGTTPEEVRDRFSSAHLLAMAGRTIRELGALREAAAEAGKPIATLGLETQIRFASAADRAAFAEDLQQAMATLISRYHDETAPNGRSYACQVGMYPSIPD